MCLPTEDLYARATRIGEQALAQLRDVVGTVVVDVRGIGAMIGVELHDGESRRRAAALPRRGVIVLTCGPDGNVLRLIPPLTITDEELRLGLDILEKALGGH